MPNVECGQGRPGVQAGLKINVDQTKTMIFGKDTTDMEDEVIENVKEFVYLSSLLTRDNDCTKEIKRRIAKAKGVMAELNTYGINQLQDQIKCFKAC